MLRFWADTDITGMISKDGSFSNPDQEDNIDGDAGAERVAELWVAIEQAKLDGGIDAEQTTIIIDQAMFTDPKYPVAIIENEQVLITDGFDTTTLTVERGHNDTTPAQHSDGTRIRAAYNASQVTILSVDIQGDDESDWWGARDYGSGSYETPHNLSDIAYNESVHIQRKVTIPASTAAQYKRDIVPRITCKLSPID